MIFLFTINSSFSQDLTLIENLILEKKYDKADSILKKNIVESNSVSSEITFLFGKNSYFLKKYTVQILSKAGQVLSTKFSTGRSKFSGRILI